MWSALKDAVFEVLQVFYNLVGDWGVAIIVLTIIFRLLLTPLMFKQSRSSYMMQKMQPKIKSVQERFADDPIRQQQEMQRIYAETKFNPLTGCLPMIIQMPIFILLFQVLRTLDERITGGDYRFLGIIDNLTYSPSWAISEGFSTFLPYLVLMIVFAGATFVPMLLQQNNTNNKNQMLLISGIMMLMMLFISWSSPAGVLLFWGVSSLIAIAQQQISLHIIKKKDIEEESAVDDTPVVIDVVRKEKKPRPTKKR